MEVVPFVSGNLAVPIFRIETGRVNILLLQCAFLFFELFLFLVHHWVVAYSQKSDYLKGAASRGVIAISDVRAELPGSGILVVDNKLQISVHSKWGRTYHIMCNSNEEARRWEREIRPFLPYRSRNNTMQTNVSLTSHFQRAESDEDDPVFELFVGQNSQKFSKV